MDSAAVTYTALSHPKGTPIDEHPHVQTISGEKIYLHNVRPEQLKIKDIAHHLSFINRFTGATDVPYSVCQHSIAVALDLEHQHGDYHLALIGLLHDAPEYLTNDISSPVKKYLRMHTDCFDKLEHYIWNQIVFKFDLVVTDEDLRLVKAADERAYFREHRIMMAKHGVMPRQVESLVAEHFLALFERYNYMTRH